MKLLAINRAINLGDLQKCQILCLCKMIDIVIIRISWIKSFLKSKMENLTVITHELIIDLIGNDSTQYRTQFRHYQNMFASYILPFLGGLIFITNMVVGLFSMLIYIQSARRRHKPAFAFISVLCFWDLLIGMWVCFFKVKSH